MKALITGSGGFVGGYLRTELEDHGYTVTGLDLQAGPGTLAADLLDREQTLAAVREVLPDTVFHLAGQADIGLSWKIPQQTIAVNEIAAVNLLEAVRAACPDCTVVLVGSSDQYGGLGAAGASGAGAGGSCGACKARAIGVNAAHRPSAHETTYSRLPKRVVFSLPLFSNRAIRTSLISPRAVSSRAVVKVLPSRVSRRVGARCKATARIQP